MLRTQPAFSSAFAAKWPELALGRCTSVAANANLLRPAVDHRRTHRLPNCGRPNSRCSVCAGGYIYQLCPAATVNKGFGSSSASAMESIEECFASRPLKFAPNAHGGFSHLVVHPDPTKDFEINATIVAEGGGAGWAIHPWPYSSGAACVRTTAIPDASFAFDRRCIFCQQTHRGSRVFQDWNPAKTGQHCKWGCPRCGAPWWSADGACPDTNCEHATELPNSTSWGKAFQGQTRGSNTVEDRVIVPNVPAGEYVSGMAVQQHALQPRSALTVRPARVGPPGPALALGLRGIEPVRYDRQSTRVCARRRRVLTRWLGMFGRVWTTCSDVTIV